jgi:hypothetical protein
MARPGYSLGITRPQSIIISLASMGPLVAFAAHTKKIQLPQRGKIIGIGLNVGARGGTHSTSTVDVLANGVSLLSAVFDVAALTPGTPVQKEIANLVAGAASVAKDAVISVVLAESGGSSPTYSDADLQIDYQPLGE